MAKMYYSIDEAKEKLGCSSDQLRNMVRTGKLREFRDAGKVHYRVDDVDKLAAGAGDSIQFEESGDLSLALEDSQDIGPPPADKKSGTKSGSKSGVALGGSKAPVNLDGTGSGPLAMESSGDLRLEESGTAMAVQPPKVTKDKGGSTVGSGTADAISLEEVEKETVEGMRKDDTVISNIGISVFEDDDLGIAVDPMAKTVITSGEDHLTADGSAAGGTGLMDLTRESDDTSLGAELLEGINLGDTAETVVPTTGTVAEPGVEPQTSEVGAESEIPMEAALGIGGTLQVATVEALSPAFTGLLIAASLSLALAGAMSMAMTMNAWPAYLDFLADKFWFFLGGTILAGGLLAGIGYLMGRPVTAGARSPKVKKEKKGRKGKGKGGESSPEEQVSGEVINLDEVGTLS